MEPETASTCVLLNMAAVVPSGHSHGNHLTAATWALEVSLAIFMVVVQSLSCVQLFVTPRTAAHQASLSFTVSQSLLTFMSIELVMLSNHLIPCHPLPFTFNLSQYQDLFQ